MNRRYYVSYATADGLVRGFGFCDPAALALRIGAAPAGEAVLEIVENDFFSLMTNPASYRVIGGRLAPQH